MNTKPAPSLSPYHLLPQTHQLSTLYNLISWLGLEIEKFYSTLLSVNVIADIVCDHWVSLPNIRPNLHTLTLTSVTSRESQYLQSNQSVSTEINSYYTSDMCPFHVQAFRELYFPSLSLSLSLSLSAINIIRTEGEICSNYWTEWDLIALSVCRARRESYLGCIVISRPFHSQDRLHSNNERN